MKYTTLHFVFLLISFNCGYTQTWSPVGVGANFMVEELGVFNDELYVGGAFTKAGGIDVKGLARWNGTKWDSVPFGGVISSIRVDGDFAVYDNKLHLAGVFDSVGISGTSDQFQIAIWDGANWTKPGSGRFDSPGNVIEALTVYAGELYVCGSIAYIDGVGPFWRIIRWNGTNWNYVGGGLTGSTLHPFAMTVFKGELYAGGWFTYAGGNPAYYIARWNGTQWNSVGSGMDQRVASFAVDTINNLLYACGDFFQAGGINAHGIAKWDGNNWSDVGSNNNNTNICFLTLAMYHGDLYVGGCFDSIAGIRAPGIARWDGQQWHPLGSGSNQTVYTMIVYHDTLFVGGWFTTMGGDSAYYIAKWHMPDTTTGIAVMKNEEYKLNIFPNPTKESFTIETHLPNTENGMIRIYGLKGELVKEYALKKGSNTTILNTSGWAKGVYVCSLEVGDEVVQRVKMVVE